MFGWLKDNFPVSRTSEIRLFPFVVCAVRERPCANKLAGSVGIGSLSMPGNLPAKAGRIDGTQHKHDPIESQSVAPRRIDTILPVNDFGSPHTPAWASHGESPFLSRRLGKFT